MSEDFAKKGKTALIAGATGLVGGEVLKLLIEEAQYKKVIVFTRRELSYKNTKIEQHIVDFNQLEKYQSFVKADHVFCCLGTTMKKAGSKENFYRVDFKYSYELARLAKENNVLQFNLISSIGANKRSLVFYNKVKGELETAIAQLGFYIFNIFRPSLLLGDRKENRTGEKFGIMLASVIAPLLMGDLKKYRAVDAQLVAKAMIKAALNEKPGEHIIESDDIWGYAEAYV